MSGDSMLFLLGVGAVDASHVGHSHGGHAVSTWYNNYRMMDIKLYT